MSYSVQKDQKDPATTGLEVNKLKEQKNSFNIDPLKESSYGQILFCAKTMDPKTATK